MPGETPMGALSSRDHVLDAWGAGEGGAPRDSSTVAERSPFNPFRRMRQRGQSRHRTGSVGEGRGDGGPRTGVEGTCGEESGGQNTARTHRGLTVEVLS